MRYIFFLLFPALINVNNENSIASHLQLCQCVLIEIRKNAQVGAEVSKRWKFIIKLKYVIHGVAMKHDFEHICEFIA